MARPLQPLSTYGTITVKKVSQRVYYASTRFRAFDGGYVRLQASGATRQAAEREVKAKAASIVDSVVKGDLTAQAIFEEVALLWLDEITGLERLAPQTIDAYESCLRRTVMQARGEAHALRGYVVHYQSQIGVRVVDGPFNEGAAGALSGRLA